jgi:hypothetical protein
MSTQVVAGPYGEAHCLEVPASAPATLLWWLITAPAYHPLWSQYVLSVVTLEDVPGTRPATLHFPGATHELGVLALNPGNPPERLTAEELQRRADAGEGFSYLLPVNIAHQFTATDDEMRQLAELACAGVVNGALNPETADAPTRIREEWLTACVKTLAHIRGEEHAP